MAASTVFIGCVDLRDAAIDIDHDDATVLAAATGPAALSRVEALGLAAAEEPAPLGFVDDADEQADGLLMLVSARKTCGGATAATGCAPSVTGPGSANVGDVIEVRATPACSGGTPELQWWHRPPGSGSFRLLLGFGAPTTLVFDGAAAAPGVHQFLARVRIRGTFTTYLSNVHAVTFAAGVPACTQVQMTSPAAGAQFKLGQSISLAAAVTCPAGVTGESQFRVKRAADATWSVLPGFGAGPVSFAPPAAGDWEFSAQSRSVGSRGEVQVTSAPVTVSVVEDAQLTAVDDTLALDEDTAATLDLLANDVGPPGAALSAAIAAPPTSGTATIVGGVLTYVPNPDRSGGDQLTYTLSDGAGHTATATVLITVRPVNDPPVAGADALEVAEDGEAGVFLLGNDADPDGEPLAILAFDPPAHGAVTITAGIAVYRPAPDYHGPDAFSYTVVDAAGATATAAVTIAVTPANDPPIALPDVAATDEDTGVTIDVLGNDSDIDDDGIAIESVTAPEHGQVAIALGRISYVPAANYHGPDAFSYTISDQHGGQATATVAVEVAAVNDAPNAAADAAALEEDQPISIDVLANDGDVDGDTLTISQLTAPAHGSVAIADGRVAYTPAANYHGDDQFAYVIVDPSGAQATAVVSVTIAPANDAPEAAGDAAQLAEDSEVTVDVAANDSDLDGDALAIASITQPAHGAATVIDGRQIRYVPAADYHGPDSLSYTLSDGHGGAATAELALVVTPVNDAPAASDDVASVDEDASVEIAPTGNDRDVDGDAIELTAVGQPAHGSAVMLDGLRVAYTPAANFHGEDSFAYTIADAAGATSSATVRVTVRPVNDAPLATADAAALDEDSAITVDVVANDFDLDGDALTITAISLPSHGLATIVDGHRVSYAAAPDYHGPDALTYTVSDGHGGAATAELAIEVGSVNDLPVAASDAGALDEDTSVLLDVVANDRDADGDALTLLAVTQPLHGAAAIADGRVQYTPAPDYHGADSFSYTIADGAGGEATAQVELSVAPVNDAPVAADDRAELAEDASATVDVVTNDRDVDGDALTVVAITAPAHGTATIVGPREVRYAPAANYHGPDAVVYTLDDGAGGQATATLALEVASVNDAPIALSGAASTFDDTPVRVALAASDADGDPLTLAIVTGPAHGSLGAIGGGEVRYTPEPGFAGSDEFSFAASDGQITSAAATISITVVRSVCGNAIAEGREECDDGNSAASDGCESTCKLTCGSGTGADRATVDAASGHCFAAYDGVQHSYQEAAAFCTSVGGHLPTVTSASEDAAALAAVHASDAPWLGGDDVAVEGTFAWITGESFARYGHFAAGQPNDAGGADCLRYAADGSWVSAACSGAVAATTGALCEFELATSTAVFATGGGSPRAAAVGDLNGDGFADAVVTNNAANSVGVLLGNGAGGMTLAGTQPAGAAPGAIASGDFDRDGRLDVAVLSTTAPTMTLLRGTATGGLVAGGTVAVAAGAQALAVADFDGDGALDLAVAATGTIQVLRGNGAGGFAALTTVAITGAPAGLAAGDLDGDGRADLAVTTAAAVLWVPSASGTAFAAPVSLLAVAGSRGVTAADLDGDGRLDLAAAGTAGATVWFGGAGGVFSAPVSLAVAGGGQAAVVGDYVGDGTRQLAVVGPTGVAVFRGAARSLAQVGAVASTGGGGALAGAAARLNADGADDLVIANPTGATLGVLLGGAGGLRGARTLAAGTTSASTLSADWNADGRADLAIVDPGTSKVFVFLQTATGALSASATISLLANAGPSFAVAADFNNDGKLDMAIANVNFSSVSVALGAGNGTFAAPTNTGVAQSPRRLAVGDWNGDGRTDIAVPAAVGNVVSILVNTGTAFGRGADVPAGAAPSAVVAGDWNGDGKADLAVVSSSEATVRVMQGRGDSTFAAATSFAVASSGASIAAGDLDGDGKVDLVSTAGAAGGVSVLAGTGTGGFAASAFTATAAGATSVAIADLDGDGRRDLVVGNTSGAVTLLHNAGGAVWSAFDVAAGGPAQAVTIADLDRNGRPEIVVATGGPSVTILAPGR